MKNNFCPITNITFYSVDYYDEQEDPAWWFLGPDCVCLFSQCKNKNES